jgi:hypothetical protein
MIPTLASNSKLVPNITARFGNHDGLKQKSRGLRFARNTLESLWYSEIKRKVVFNFCLPQHRCDVIKGCCYLL